jgi:flagellar protein FlgJ
MTSKVADANVLDLSGLAALKRDARAQDPNAVREVAKQFESIFAKMVLSSMRQATFGDSLFGSEQQKFYQGMFDDQLAVELTKGRGLGLADMLVRQLSQAGLVPKEAADATANGAASPPAGNEAPKMSTSGAADVAGKKGSIPIGASAGAGMKDSIPIAASSGAKSGSSATARAPAFTSEFEGYSSTLLGMSDAGAPEISDAFIEKMLAGNAAAAQPREWRAQSREDFVKQLWPCAEEAGRELGIDPRHLLAQAALETGWGKSLPCDTNGATSFNFFGIKAGTSWEGDSVSVKTLEFEGGLPVPRHAKFRSYESAEDSFRDYVEVLRSNPRYAAALNTGSDAKAFATALQQGGYATDPKYAQKIESIAQNLPAWNTALKSSADEPMPSPTRPL